MKRGGGGGAGERREEELGSARRKLIGGNPPNSSPPPPFLLSSFCPGGEGDEDEEVRVAMVTEEANLCSAEAFSPAHLERPTNQSTRDRHWAAAPAVEAVPRPSGHLMTSSQPEAVTDQLSSPSRWGRCGCHGSGVASLRSSFVWHKRVILAGFRR